MTDQKTQSTGALSIPADTQSKFSELIELIRGSESMNDQERQYWINILPIMKDEQRTNLKEILVNEKEQLAAIDKKYAAEVKAATSGGQSVHETGKKIRETKQKRQSAEAASEAEEEGVEGSILEKIQNL